MKRITILLLLSALVLSCTKNMPPVATISVSPITGTTDTLFIFDASASYDAETPVDQLRFRWDFESDGSWDTELREFSEVTHKFSQPAAYNVKVEVRDEDGLANFETLLVWVDRINTPPNAVLRNETQVGRNTESFEFDASGSFDAETKTEELVVRWDWTNDGDWDTEFSRDKRGNHTFDIPGTYKTAIEIIDSGGLTDTTSIAVTIMPFTGTFIDSRDHHEYTYVVIGSQTWMSENLAYLPRWVNTPENGGEDKPYYYVYNVKQDTSFAILTLYYKVYGALYNWKAAQTACPYGWHLPSDEEWMVLEQNLGMKPIELRNIGARNTGKVGKKLKSTDLWIDNAPGDNTSGFNALPAAGRSSYYGSFYGDLL